MLLSLHLVSERRNLDRHFSRTMDSNILRPAEHHTFIYMQCTMGAGLICVEYQLGV
jgi:hypothetical protein